MNFDIMLLFAMELEHAHRTRIKSLRSGRIVKGLRRLAFENSK